MNSTPAGAVGLALNLNENQQEQGSPPDHHPYNSVTLGLVEKAFSSMNIATQKISDLTATLLQLEAARQERHEELCRNMQLEMEKLSQVLAALAKREAEETERKSTRMDVDLELQKAAMEPADHRFNWMFGHGVAPRVGARATKSQAKFERIKTAVKLNALWFTNNATHDELLPTFIQFNDDPRISLDGHFLKSFLLHEEDACPLFGLALTRVLRKDEGRRDVGPDGNTHYASYKWADKVVWENGSIDECEEIFMEPKTPYAFCGCTKVVAQLRLDESWAALSIDLKRGATYLIHPAAAGADHKQVLAQFIGMMRTLTMAAQIHMNKLARYNPTGTLWNYEIALKSPLAIHPNDTAIAAAFYSIPKDGQFLPVSYETISLAKYTFIHSLMKMCYPVTKQPIRKGWKRANMKRAGESSLLLTTSTTRVMSNATMQEGAERTRTHRPASRQAPQQFIYARRRVAARDNKPTRRPFIYFPSKLISPSIIIRQTFLATLKIIGL